MFFLSPLPWRNHWSEMDWFVWVQFHTVTSRKLVITKTRDQYLTDPANWSLWINRKGNYWSEMSWIVWVQFHTVARKLVITKTRDQHLTDPANWSLWINRKENYKSVKILYNFGVFLEPSSVEKSLIRDGLICLSPISYGYFKKVGDNKNSRSIPVGSS